MSGVALPSDIWAIILLSLDVSDIRRCQAVCRTFYQLTKTLCELQFRLELDNAGYVESPNPRTDVTLEEKLAILREHMSRRESLKPSRVDKLWVEAGEDMAGDPPLNSYQRVLLVRGVLACGTTKVSDEGTTLRIDVARLPSLNRGTDMQQWTLYESELPIRTFWIEPDLDMLVLSEIPSDLPAEVRGLYVGELV